MGTRLGTRLGTHVECPYLGQLRLVGSMARDYTWSGIDAHHESQRIAYLRHEHCQIVWRAQQRAVGSLAVQVVVGRAVSNSVGRDVTELSV